MTKVWGPITWELLHIFTYKINEEYFISNRKTVLMIIYNILASLPCSECSEHAVNIYKLNVKKIVNKKTFIEFIFLLHNSVNTKLKKRSESVDILKKYENINIKDTIIKWYTIMNSVKGIPKLMGINMNNKIIRNNIMAFFKKNITYFT